MTAPPTDSFHRKIDYLRLSITDRCNLRCTYCMPQSGVPKLDHSEILRYEEILRVARIAVSMGIANIRITGGEPLVRKEALSLCESIAGFAGTEQSEPYDKRGLTFGVCRGAIPGRASGVSTSAWTPSNPKRFSAIARKDFFGRVWEGIIAAHEVGHFTCQVKRRDNARGK